MIDLSRVSSGAARADAGWWYEAARENVRNARIAFSFGSWSYGLVCLLFAEHERTVARLARRGVHPSLWPSTPEALLIPKAVEKSRRRRRAPRAAKR